MAGVIDEYVAACGATRLTRRSPAALRRGGSLLGSAEADPAPRPKPNGAPPAGLAREIAAQFATDAIDRQAKRPG
jgi:hypothetical protein